ncbi:MAG: DUF1573 domain-containing protein [Planctomycetaceae bacterium]|nr:DUF1573 domain-containing protein [Planctomycetaceae bacterium]
MKPSGVVLCVVFAAAALAGTVWVGRYRGETPTILKGTPKDVPVGPPIAASGPYPTAVADELEYNFGAMPVGAKGKHDYVIRNDGQADLVVMARKEDTTCSCTVGELSSDDGVKPGESVTVTLQWEIKAPTEQFRHQAIVRTNDPEHKAITLVVTGQVDETLKLHPASPWTLGEMSATEPSVVTGHLVSPHLERFDIQSAQADRETTKVEWSPLTPEQIAEMAEQKIKCGYKFTIAVSPDIPIGAYGDTVNIVTSEEIGGEISLKLAGIRKGPLEFFGPNYHREAGVITMGEFPAAEGKDLSLSVFVHDLESDLELQDVKQEHNTVRISMQKDEKFAGKGQRYYLKVTVPPGLPQNRQRKNSEKVDLFFNHPQAKQTRLIVDFLATPPDL